MSRSWSEQELQAASSAMNAAGHMSYEEFCEELKRQQVSDKIIMEAVEELRDKESQLLPARELVKTPE